MTQQAYVWLMLALALAGANLPFLSERLFLVGPRRAPKAFGWRLLELLCFGGLVLAMGWLIEGSIGQRAPQQWQFFAAFGCLFLTLGFPGFVWRYLRRASAAGAHA